MEYTKVSVFSIK